MTSSPCDLDLPDIGSSNLATRESTGYQNDHINIAIAISFLLLFERLIILSITNTLLLSRLLGHCRVVPSVLARISAIYIMASIFTYDPEPQRVSSPWLQPADSAKKPGSTASPSPDEPVQESVLSDYGLTKLAAEPQDGPTEYKLHLLLRPRRVYKSMSTTTRIAGSQQGRQVGESKNGKGTMAAASSSQSRQSRLEQLTTQLLWRLQQSSPYHSSSSTDIVLPQLPENAFDADGAARPAKLLPGLEASRGALYEIGVADDGTLVGLTRDELDESVGTLRAMAASLGCDVEIQRMIVVGEAEWDEPAEAGGDPSTGVSGGPTRRTGKLWVSEALVTPHHGSMVAETGPLARAIQTAKLHSEPRTGSSTTDQLRVTLTGPTTSGKSTLLGTLSTGTLDNGRGKSRLTLLKHLHEVASGVTSSVSQELIGYKDGWIYNFSHPNIESWMDIHDRSEGGRLVFVCDSAGHPRYRRTTLRGLVGWAPHWTVLCIGADVGEPGTAGGSQAGEPLGPVDLAAAHLDLCLKLDTPLAIVVTKMDLATGTTLRGTLKMILSAVKSSGRTPMLVANDQRSHADLTEIPEEDQKAVKVVTDAITSSDNLRAIVPIVLASAVKGTGIAKVHALLRNLPLPPPPTSHDYCGQALNPEQPTSLFHIEERFSLPATYGTGANGEKAEDMGTVVSGYLRFGRLSVNDKVLVGPFPSEDDLRTMPIEDRPSLGHGLSVSHPSSGELAKIASRNAVYASAIKGEWHPARVVSLRNLRLPVKTLEPGQVGTVGLVLEIPDDDDPADSIFEAAPPAAEKLAIRKGMVVAIPSRHMVESGLSLQAASGITASFTDRGVAYIVIGSFVNIYVASVRAAARVTSISSSSHAENSNMTAVEDIDDVFELNELVDGGQHQHQHQRQQHQQHQQQPVVSESGFDVRLDLIGNREWFELGSKIVLLEGGRVDKTGLEGFVGSVVEIFE